MGAGHQDLHPGANAQTVGNQIVVLPDGTLVNALVRITDLASPKTTSTIVVQRSTDHGSTWSEPIDVAAANPVGVVDPASGTLYLAWEDSRFGPPGSPRDGIAISRSTDGGASWSGPVQVNGDPAVQAFTPALAASAGVVAVTYYDFRFYDPARPSSLPTAAWLATSTDGVNWRESPLGAPFDIHKAPVSAGYFLGDYEGLIARNGSFMAFFVMTNPGSGQSSDVFAESPTSPFAQAVAGLRAVQGNVHPRPLADRLRASREDPRPR